MSGKCCVKCGSTTRLELDHVDPGTKVDHRIWSWSTARMLAEIAKCQVLCKVCHVRKSINDGPRTEHGQRRMYTIYKCRCEPCRNVHNSYCREYRARKKLAP